jgi:hypothetical protein
VKKESRTLIRIVVRVAKSCRIFEKEKPLKFI